MKQLSQAQRCKLNAAKRDILDNALVSNAAIFKFAAFLHSLQTIEEQHRGETIVLNYQGPAKHTASTIKAIAERQTTIGNKERKAIAEHAEQILNHFQLWKQF